MPRIPFLSDALLGPQNRREFLKRVTGAAASAALPKLPGVPADASPGVLPAAGLNPADILPPAFENGFHIPGVGGLLVSMDGKPVVWGENELMHMTKQQMLRTKAILGRANSALPVASGDQPLFYNHMTNQWHEMAGESNINAIPESWRTRWLKAGRTAPPGHRALEHSGHLKEDFDESLWAGEPLTQPAGVLTQGGRVTDKRGLLHDIEKDWARERGGYLRNAIEQEGGDARKVDADVLQDFGLTPGGRFNPLEGLNPSREVELPIEQPRQPYMSKVRKAAAAAPFLAVPLLAPREDEE